MQTAEPPRAEQPVPAPRPILVINDAREFLELLREFLAEEGYAVATHASGEGVLDLVHALDPALVILDLVLGEIDGWVVLTQLRADDRARELPVIVCTAASDRARTFGDELAAAGVHVLEKPFDREHLPALIVDLAGAPGGAGWTEAV